MARRWRRGLQTGAGLLLALTVVTACTPAPAPTPTPTGFASDEEAFAAAESTVRDYIAAMNAVVVSTPATFDAALNLSTGEQNAFDRKKLSRYHADGYTIAGETEIVSLATFEWNSEAFTARVRACVDVSKVDVRDASGSSIVSPDRPPIQALDVSLEGRGNSFLIDAIAGDPDGFSCSS